MEHKKMEVWCGCLRIEQRRDSSVESDTCTAMDIRRVNREGTEEIQISITVAKLHEKRTVTSYGSLTLDPNEADHLITALSKIHPPHNEVPQGFKERNQFWADFYDLS